MSELKKQLGDGWYKLIGEYTKGKEFKKLGEFLSKRRKAFNVRVLPEPSDVFRAFRECPLEDLKVVMIGVEPYTTRELSNGLAFAFTGAGPMPMTMANIYREYETDVMNGLDLMFDYSLHQWSKQGVLMLNMALTVEEGKRGSHLGEWGDFLNHILTKLDETQVGIVYLCMGEHSHHLHEVFNRSKRNIPLNTYHPLDKKFQGSKPFTKINKCLTEVAKGLDIEPEDYIIKW